VIPPSLKNISKLPPSIQPVIAEFADKIFKSLDDNLHSIFVYGSAAGVNYNHGVSNINIAVIVKNLDFSVLSQSLALVKWGRKHKISTPLFLTKEYILNSLDVFPIEFSEIKEQHEVIFGEDIFEDLDIPLKDVRLLCEQQVKGKLLHLRQAYLDIGPNPSVLKNLLLSALSDLVPVFRQLIILKGQKPVEQKEEMLGQLARIFSLDSGPFLAVYHDKNRKILISSNQVEAHLQNFLNQLESLSRHMDSL
jgi:predicted nucleotidyltransferase